MTKIVTFSADPETMLHIEREMLRLARVTPEEHVTRSAAIRLLIARGAKTRNDAPTE